MQILEKVGVRGVLDALKNRQDLTTGTTELETYSFWHVPYDEVAYYNQLVFKRHQPIPPEKMSGWSAPQRVPGSSVGSLAGIPTREL